MASIWLRTEECRENGLPPYCIVCGEATNEHEPIRYTFRRVPPWVWFFFLVSWILVIILALIFQKKQRVWTPLCEEHRGYWTNRNWLTVMFWGGLFGYIASIFLMIGSGFPPWTFIAAFASFIATALLFAIVIFLSVRPTSIDEDGIILTNVNQRFCDELRADRDADLETFDYEYQDWIRRRDEKRKEVGSEPWPE